MMMISCRKSITLLSLLLCLLLPAADAAKKREGPCTAAGTENYNHPGGNSDPKARRSQCGCCGDKRQYYNGQRLSGKRGRHG